MQIDHSEDNQSITIIVNKNPRTEIEEVEKENLIKLILSRTRRYNHQIPSSHLGATDTCKTQEPNIRKILKKMIKTKKKPTQ